MPYLLSQHRLFEAAARNPAIARRKGIPQDTAARLASEGVKSESASRARVANALASRGMKY